MPDRGVVDQDVRDLVVKDLTTTFLLEAAAGTGKTRVLVDRYVACVLDPRHGAGDVRAVAAVTFTEKAAGELRQRIREALEVRAQGEAADEQSRAAAQRALDDLDDASIATIHGFAGKLLREFPVQAGVDPAFEQLDALAGGMERTRAWDEWLAGLADEAADGSPARDWLGRLLQAGVRLDDVRALAITAGGVFDERYDVDPISAPPQEPDLLASLQELAAPLQELRQYCEAACGDPSDRGYGAAAELAGGVERLLDHPPQSTDALAARLFALPVKERGPGGDRRHWDDTAGGKDRLELLYGDLRTRVCGLRERYAAFVTGLALAVADTFARWAAETQIATGKLDFADLLGRLRDLLVADMEARRALQARFRYILVDEFQDTDPLQAEIVFLLAEQEPRAADWKAVRLEPGKLFVVGDPKQSIYRFRRADIRLYDEVKDLIAAQPGGTGEILAITQNFRTTPAAVEWANDIFTDVFGEDQAKGRQPGYERVAAYRPPMAGDAAVSVLLGRVYDRAADQARRDEARAIAALLHQMTGGSERWRVQDGSGPDPGTGGGAERTRAARWGDIAILMRTMTGLPAYEHALREAGVPFRIEGGATYFERREVADALVCLRAIDDPSDGPAVYAALHSTLFGFSDDDLFLFVAAEGRLDVFADDQPGDGDPAGVPEALRLLRDLHVRRTACEPHEIVAELLLRTRAAELAASSGAAAAQALSNLDKLVEQARAFCGAGGGGLAAFLSWAAEAGEAAGEQESQVDDAGDVVRLLTIHKAKGLEFPIVIVAAGAQQGGGGRDGVKPIVDRAGRRLAIKLKAALPGLAPEDLVPESYRSLKEHEDVMEASELRRLLYVAATRARDHLVLSCFGALVRKAGEQRKNVMLALLKDHIPLPQERACSEERTESGILVLAPSEPPQAAVRAFGDAGGLAAAREDWIRARDDLLARAQAPFAATSPSALELLDDDDEDGAASAAASPGRAGALALGSIVHACMESCRLDDESSIGPAAAVAAAVAGRPDLAAEAATLAAACWRSAPARAAAASPRAYRELPVGVELEGVVVSGAIDLLYEDDGAWAIADYKTDRDADPETLRRRYLQQAAAYALAVEAATRGVVREVVLVAARDGGRDVSLPVDDALRDLARDGIARAGRAGAALAADELG